MNRSLDRSCLGVLALCILAIGVVRSTPGPGSSGDCQQYCEMVQMTAVCNLANPTSFIVWDDKTCLYCQGTYTNCRHNILYTSDYCQVTSTALKYRYADSATTCPCNPSPQQLFDSVEAWDPVGVRMTEHDGVKWQCLYI